jgi:aryl-alcohol dehydrogenase-like predicted oxidoreductase
MKYRALGRTGLSVSEIGFGAWGIGGRTVAHTSYGDTDDATSLSAP